MLFWRKKNNQSEQEQQEKEERLLHRPDDLQIGLPSEIEPQIDPHDVQDLAETETEVIDHMKPIPEPEPDSALFAPVSEPDSPEEDTEETGGWLSRLASGLTKSSSKIGQGLSDLVSKKKPDAAMLSDLEDLLIEADLGPATAARIVKTFAQTPLDRDATVDEIRIRLAGDIAKLLQPVAKPFVVRKPDKGPFVILVCGVNGVGKTTTIGKLAKIMHDTKHHKVMMVAGDTFRAAAVEQLQIWGTRAHCPVVTRDIGADAAALAYEAYEQAVRDGIEVMIVDTAGRLHNKSNLMAELEKIVRVLKKHNPDLPHETLLVLDGTTGQNAFAQVETFKEMVNISGLVVTKLDGSARGGVVVGLADKFGLPIYAVGVGEGVEDLQPFTAEGYARSLLGLG